MTMARTRKGRAGADRERNLSIADEFNGVAFRCIPVELTARGSSKSIRENLFGVVWRGFLSSRTVSITVLGEIIAFRA